MTETSTTIKDVCVERLLDIEQQHHDEYMINLNPNQSEPFQEIATTIGYQYQSCRLLYNSSSSSLSWTDQIKQLHDRRLCNALHLHESEWNFIGPSNLFSSVHLVDRILNVKVQWITSDSHYFNTNTNRNGNGIILGPEMAYIITNLISSPFQTISISFIIIHLGSSLKGPHSSLLCVRKSAAKHTYINNLFNCAIQSVNISLSDLAAATIMWEKVVQDNFIQHVSNSKSISNQLFSTIQQNSTSIPFIQEIKQHSGWISLKVIDKTIAYEFTRLAEFIGISFGVHETSYQNKSVYILLSTLSLASNTVKNFYDTDPINKIVYWICKIFNCIAEKQQSQQQQSEIIMLQTQFRYWYNKEYRKAYIQEKQEQQRHELNYLPPLSRNATLRNIHKN